MRKYLATLHTKPVHHKKRFALLTSGTFTLIIFAFWSVATFGSGGTLAQNDIESLRANREVGPIESLQANVGESWQGIKDGVGELLNIYGQ